MLKYFTLFLFLYISSYSQDTIYFRSGQITPAKVTEVGINEIKYYKNSNSEGPLYTETKNEIKKIKYSGSRIDSFTVVATKANTIAPPLNYANPYSNLPPNYIQYRGGGYFLGTGERLTPDMVLDAAESLAKTKKITELKALVYLTRRDYRMKMITLPLGITSLALGLGCLEIGLISYSSYSSTGILWACPLFLGAGIPLMIMNGKYHKSQKKNLRKVASMYNTYAFQ